MKACKLKKKLGEYSSDEGQSGNGYDDIVNWSEWLLPCIYEHAWYESFIVIIM